jgi:hypothetical protein
MCTYEVDKQMLHMINKYFFQPTWGRGGDASKKYLFIMCNIC